MNIHEIRKIRDKCQELARAKAAKVAGAQRSRGLRVSRNFYMGLVSKYAAEFRRKAEQEILNAAQAKWLADRQKKSKGDWKV